MVRRCSPFQGKKKHVHHYWGTSTVFAAAPSKFRCWKGITSPSAWSSVTANTSTLLSIVAYLRERKWRYTANIDGKSDRRAQQYRQASSLLNGVTVTVAAAAARSPVTDTGRQRRPRPRPMSPDPASPSPSPSLGVLLLASRPSSFCCRCWWVEASTSKGRFLEEWAVGEGTPGKINPRHSSTCVR